MIFRYFVRNSAPYEKGYGRWFDQLHPVIKSRYCCQMKRAFEPSAPDWNQLPKNRRKMRKASQFVQQTVYSSKAQRKGEEEGWQWHFNNHVLEFIEKTIENDPTKEIINFLKDVMERSTATWAATVETVTNQTVNQTPGNYGNAAVPSQMYGNTVPNSPSFPLQPSYMYQAQYQGQSYPDSQNV